MSICINQKYILRSKFLGLFDKTHLFAKVSKTYEYDDCTSGIIVVVDIYYFGYIRQAVHLDHSWLGEALTDQAIIDRAISIVQDLLDSSDKELLYLNK